MRDASFRVQPAGRERVLKQKRKKIELIPLLGKIFEQKVYTHLIKFKNARYNVKENGEVDDTYLNPQIFKQFYEEYGGLEVKNE